MDGARQFNVTSRRSDQEMRQSNASISPNQIYPDVQPPNAVANVDSDHPRVQRPNLVDHMDATEIYGT